MAKLGHPRAPRYVWWIAGAVAVFSIVASFGVPKAGCGGPPDDDQPAADAHSASSLLEAVDHTPAAPDGASLMRLYPIAGSMFCPTAGRVSSPGVETFNVNTSGMRGVVAADASRSVELAFVYRGEIENSTPLANGEMRRQIGLKLRAKDTCNVVYVMWHVSPSSGIAVSVKSNPGLATHVQCGDRGYINLKNDTDVSVPEIEPNEPHTLRADLDGELLRVHADGIETWSGPLPAEASAFDGPVGIRSDNGDFDFQLRVPGGGDRAARCKNAGTEQAH